MRFCTNGGCAVYRWLAQQRATALSEGEPVVAHLVDVGVSP
jgi:hypothetical protein